MKNRFNNLFSKPIGNLAPDNLTLRIPAAFIFLFFLIQLLPYWYDALPPNGAAPNQIEQAIPKCSSLGNPISLSCFEISFAANAFQQRSDKSIFGDDPSAISVVWSILWRIPWKAQFGKLFEWTPFFLSLVWLFIWHLIMLVIHYFRTQKQQTVSSMFYEFTKFVQIIYGFCCTQALL